MNDGEKRQDPQPESASAPPAMQTEPNLLDSLFISPEEAQKIEAERASIVPASPEPELSEEEDSEELLPEQVDRICKAVDRLARKGLNSRAVIALLHDANPTIPKKHIKAVLEGLRELPAIYGRTKGA